MPETTRRKTEPRQLTYQYYFITAKAEREAIRTLDEFREMLQSLLADVPGFEILSGVPVNEGAAFTGANGPALVAQSSWTVPEPCARSAHPANVSQYVRSGRALG
jgi:hypothetical protein